MITFPNAKINLGLNVISKRSDGYHNISSCFYPIGWSDVLEIIPSKSFQFTTSGLPISRNIDTNLCVKAFRLLEKEYHLNPVHIHLHKVIPMGSGLGGGSSDGAFTLKLLNQLFKLNKSTEKLQHYASLLGSDCTFFIKNKPALISGTGNRLTLSDFDLKDCQIIVVCPNIHISTRITYQEINPQAPDKYIQDILLSGIKSFKKTLKNDFEKSINNTEIFKVKKELYQKGAIYASMSGSGSSVYGLFSSDIDLNKIKTHFDTYVTWKEFFK